MIYNINKRHKTINIFRFLWNRSANVPKTKKLKHKKEHCQHNLVNYNNWQDVISLSLHIRYITFQREIYLHGHRHLHCHSCKKHTGLIFGVRVRAVTIWLPSGRHDPNGGLELEVRCSSPDPSLGLPLSLYFVVCTWPHRLQSFHL